MIVGPLIILHDSNNFTTKHSYIGNDSIKLGNGLGMTISHIGSTVFYSPTHKNTVVLHKSFAYSQEYPKI